VFLKVSVMEALILEGAALLMDVPMEAWMVSLTETKMAGQKACHLVWVSVVMSAMVWVGVPMRFRRARKCKTLPGSLRQKDLHMWMFPNCRWQYIPYCLLVARVQGKTHHHHTQEACSCNTLR
jgi:hypothetical protein